MSSVFTKIISREIPANIVAEDAQFLAFLDINPVAKGHVLVIPKVEIDYIFNLDDTMLSEMMIFVKKVAAKIKKVVPCNRIGITVIGLEVPHAHIHLIPISSLSDMSFEKERVVISSSDMEALTDKIKNS